MGEVSLGGRHAGLKAETGDLFMKTNGLVFGMAVKPAHGSPESAHGMHLPHTPIFVLNNC